ncbi:MAG: hypothetical protein JWQ39_2154 [Glaciihabitans sp.]|nr:hypothetical protein [Glaciihabitans sp.]
MSILNGGETYVPPARDFGNITPSEVLTRGRTVNPFTHEQVATAEERVRKTGMLERLATWHAQDHVEGGGGRPAIISERAILTGMLLLASEHKTLWISTLAQLFQQRLDAESRTLLGLPPTATAFDDQLRTQKQWYRNTHNAFHRMLSVMDPFPQDRHFAINYTQVQATIDAHDHDHERRMKARLDEFTNAFLHMTFMEQSRKLRRATTNIDISLDQTFIHPPNKKGFSRKGLPSRVKAERGVNPGQMKSGPVEVFAGLYPRKGSRPDIPRGATDTTGPEEARSKGYSDLVWGWMANIAVRVDSEKPSQRRFPKLAVSATLSQPNIAVSEEAVALMQAALSTGLNPGLVDADKDYFAKAVTARLHEPTFNLGFTPSTDYRVDRLGVQEQKAGAELIEGTYYCPSMPAVLKDATKIFVHGDERGFGRDDDETFYIRRNARRDYELRPKEKPDEKGRVPMMCPALGDSPTVTCPLRELSKNAIDKERTAIEEENLPSFMDKICKQHSVSFHQSDGLRQRQAFPYKSKEWDEFHKHARNSIESLNDQVKDGGTEQLELSTRRRVRGFAAAGVFVAILLTNYNLRTIAAFIQEELLAELNPPDPTIPAREKLKRRRDRVWHNPYTNTYPVGAKPVYGPQPLYVART